jgi:uncharacterized membrane protein YfcA
MVSLIEHATDARTPGPTSWLLAGSVSALLVALVATIVTLVDYRRLAALYRPLAVAMLLGAVAALAIGWARPVPWLLATLLDLVLIDLVLFAFARSLRTTRPHQNPASYLPSAGRQAPPRDRGRAPRTGVRRRPRERDGRSEELRGSG